MANLGDFLVVLGIVVEYKYCTIIINCHYFIVLILLLFFIFFFSARQHKAAGVKTKQKQRLRRLIGCSLC